MRRKLMNEPEISMYQLMIDDVSDVCIIVTRVTSLARENIEYCLSHDLNTISRSNFWKKIKDLNIF